MIPVILSGGSGERLWPLSRQKCPKPFLELFEKSLFVKTLLRVKGAGKPLVVAAQSQRTLVERGLRDIGLQAWSLYEPEGRNTAVAIAVACRYLEIQGMGDDVIAILPADHSIGNEAAFSEVLKIAEAGAKSTECVVTLGVEPTHAATGYGYIELADAKLNTLCNIEKFVEKPDKENAEAFLAAGQFYWNAGIFVAQVSKLIELFQTHQPQLWSELSKLAAFETDDLAPVYKNLQSVSFDVGIMEKASPNHMFCIPVDIKWSDLGSWNAVAEADTSRVTHHQVSIGSSDNYVRSHRNKTYALLGVDHLIVVDTADALLIAHKDKIESIKDLVAEVGKSKPTLLQEHTFDIRPWGCYEVLRSERHFKTKIIEVEPAQQISYQSHDQREEHWIVVQGSGEVTLNDQVLPVERGSYIHIPVKSKHRIRNTGSDLLQFVEVEIGTYFGEDDITRYDDDYSRE